MRENKLLSTNQLVIRIFAVLLTVASLVMLLLSGSGVGRHPVAMAAIGVGLLALLATPGIFLLVVKPFVLARDRALEDASALALTDPLTQLANRRHFQKLLVQEHARRARSGSDLSVILLDVDHFKPFNDRYGHLCGDQCLRRVAQVVGASMSRPADLAARFGGEEFVCILPETSPRGARAMAEEIREAVEALRIPHLDSEGPEHVTVSAGVASLCGSQQASVDDLLNEADKLLYLAKARGRNRVEFDTGDLDPQCAASFVKLVWRDAYFSGDALVDEQHQKLFRVADDLLAGVLAGRGPEEVSALVSALLKDLREHFRDEIQMLKTLGYTGLREHAEEHVRLLGRAEEFAQASERGALSVGELFQFLAQDVIIDHMLAEDRKFFPLTRARSEAAAH